MPFDARAARDAWDRAAESYTEGQATGLDHYRYEFFGPAHAALCGDVAGLRLLDVGCGSGYFTREMAARGAHATGVDIAPRMIERARATENKHPLGIAYVVADAADLAGEFPATSFDIATSCLALQDMPEPATVLRQVKQILRAGARFVISIEHPCTNPPFRAWERDAQRRKRWLCIDRYYERGPREYRWTRWPTPFTTTALHATLEDWFGWIRDAGFLVHALREPQPTAAAVQARPALADATRVPYFLMLDLRAGSPLG